MTDKIIPLHPARPVERIPNGSRVTVDLAPQLGLILPGVVTGCSFAGTHRYDVDLGFLGMKLINIPASRIKREGDVA